MDKIGSEQSRTEDAVTKVISRLKDFIREQEHPVKDPAMIRLTRNLLLRAIDDFDRLNDGSEV